VLALFWIATGLVSLGPGYTIGLALMEEGGAAAWGPATVVAGALADLPIGISIALIRSARVAPYGAIAITPVHIVVGILLVPPVERSARAYARIVVIAESIFCCCSAEACAPIMVEGSSGLPYLIAFTRATARSMNLS
jgi:hypothetical protein